MSVPKPRYRLVRSYGSPRIRRDRLVLEQGEKQDAIDGLLKARKNRSKLGNKMAKQGAGVVGSIAGIRNVVLENSSMRRGLAQVLVTAIAGAAAGKWFAYGASSIDITNATERVGVALHEEVPHSQELKRFLGSWRYVYVDGKGNLVGSNVGRFLKIGRMRLETNKILAGMY